MTQFYAHSLGEDKTKWQSIKQHLENVANLAAQLSINTPMQGLSETAALLHDIGKYSESFQKRISGDSKQRVDHATAGAIEIRKKYKTTSAHQIYADMIAYSILGHHGGLPNFGTAFDLKSDGTFCGRLKKTFENELDYSAYRNEIFLDKKKMPNKCPIRTTGSKNMKYNLAFLTKMIYSILVDADFIDTENFINSSNGRKRPFLFSLSNNLAKNGLFSITNFAQQQPPESINLIRKLILEQSLLAAEKETGFFALDVPTGGGKTFSSLAFALAHAQKNNLKRIIYVIPYTTIIEQNAQKIKELLKKEIVLEHHSNFDWQALKKEKEKDEKIDGEKDDYDDDLKSKLKLASENWDYPIILTTNVMFFESLFANKPARSRKIHNITNSVLIFDEVQSLPQGYLTPCMMAIAELVENYHCSVVFCSATKPPLENFIPQKKAIQKIITLSEEQKKVFDRVSIKYLKKKTDADIVKAIAKEKQCLCVVNTRKHAKGLFDLLDCDKKYHLSTLMCPQHRLDIISKIKSDLQEEKPCRVISTQLMEAGVDLDFAVGYRALAGLDSIIQVAGRVNREGKRKKSVLNVFEPNTELIKKVPTHIQQGGKIAQEIMAKFGDQIFSEQALLEYYRELYHLYSPGYFDQQGIMNLFYPEITNELSFDFETIAEKFRIIENDMVAIIVPYMSSLNSETTNIQELNYLLAKLQKNNFDFSDIRKIQKYSVNVYRNEFEDLANLGLIDCYAEKYNYLNNADYYDKDTGLRIIANEKGQAVFIDS